MRVLVLGSGGREHALVWKLQASPLVDDIFCIPGNAGISQISKCENLSLSHFPKIENFILDNKIDLTIVGPEQPLVDGIVDYLSARKLKVFGPVKEAAQLEGSKSFAKNFMKKYGIPTAAFEIFEDYQTALDYLDKITERKIVVKADGLAAGKGSIVCQNLNEARFAVKCLMVDKIFGEAGGEIVIEECMEGEEASLFVIADGKDFVLLSPAQDFKRALDGDNGKNTGGMGSYAPTPVLSQHLIEKTVQGIVKPVLEGLKSEGIMYKGVLYCGLMLTAQGPQVIEFNCRFGDPETQVVLPLLKSDLMEILLASVDGKLHSQNIELHDGYAVCVIAASGGYPDSYEKGKLIRGLDQMDSGHLLFHAGTRFENEEYYTDGGRVLGLTGLGSNLPEAVNMAYRGIQKIQFDKIHYRKDIAKRIIGKYNLTS